MQDIEQAIRERAYHLWIEDGCRDGHAATHWLAAQRDILSAAFGNLDVTASKQPEPVAKPKQAKAPRKKRAA
jgi:hypothetical protein